MTIKHSGTVTKHFGIDKFYDATYFDMSDDNIVNLGLKDKPFFKASADYQSKMKTVLLSYDYINEPLSIHIG